MTIKGAFLAIEAGMCAALASVSAKLATSFDLASELAISSHPFLENILHLHFLSVEETTIGIRIISVLAIFLFNALMWVFFTKSMHKCSSTLEATAFNLASNFISTAIVGKLFFGEYLDMTWYIGSLLIVIGLTVLHVSTDNKHKKTETDSKHLKDSYDKKES